ncbi:MAG: DNA primase [Alphaproteobacteria bacterium]|nr:DNA primase [Alphaproteobacteria bacterium]
MALPQQFLDELRARVSVSAIVGRRVRLERRGREHTGLCPFHKEKSPSFTVNDDKGFFHCFGCGAHGDAFAFVMQSEGLSFREAVERLAGEAGMELARETPREAAEAEGRRDLESVVEAACAWFEEQLATPAGAAARAYLERRGIGPDMRRRFRIGYAPDGRGRLVQAMAGRGYPLDRLVAAGLVKAGEDGGAPRDYFFDRVIFPIGDRRGRIVAFGGRTLGDAKPKYLNSPDSEVFHKGRLLYNLAAARAASRECGAILVVEGYTDVIALARAGVAHAVAPLGTALTEDQIGLLWRLVDEPVLCFDGDAAGARAAERAARRALPLLVPGKSLRFLALPDGEDPDSLLAHRGPQALVAALARPRPLVEVLWQAELGALPTDTPERRAGLRQRLGELARTVTEPAVREQYAAAFAERFEEAFPARPPRGLWQQRPWRPGGRRGPAGPGAGPGAVPFAARGDVDGVRLQAERILIALLVNHPALVDSHHEALAEIRLESQILDRMLRQILHIAVLSPQLDVARMERHLMEHGFGEPLTEIRTERFYKTASFVRPGGDPGPTAEALNDMLNYIGRAGRAAARHSEALTALTANDGDVSGERYAARMRDEVGTGDG